jgi:hypothetical protein
LGRLSGFVVVMAMMVLAGWAMHARTHQPGGLEPLTPGSVERGGLESETGLRGQMRGRTMTDREAIATAAEFL